MLQEFVATNTQEIIARTRALAASRAGPRPTEAELKNGVPLFLQQLIARLTLSTANTDAIGESAAQHGGELLTMGFTVSQVVRGYGDVCQAITRLAEETNAPITVDEFRLFNRCLDEAIARAVAEYERLRDASVADAGTERRGVLAHELRNRLAAAVLAFGILREGTVAIGGSTGAVLGRNLRAMQHLINNSLAEVRLESGSGERCRVSVSELIGEVEAEAGMEAEVSGIRLAVAPVARDLHVDVDPQIVVAALGNLLQNAFKFTRPRGLVSLRPTAIGELVLIEVEDECGGLPPGRAEDLFRPFEQKGAQHAGLGLGLSISRSGIEAMGGAIKVRDLPGKGCIFRIELPRSPMV